MLPPGSPDQIRTAVREVAEIPGDLNARFEKYRPKVNYLIAVK
jgi:hypothetical protein